MRLANILRSYLGLPIACALGVAIGVVAIYGRRNPHDVRTVSPVYEDISSVVSTNGKVFPITDFQARAATPGIVGEIYVHVGQRVSPGQLLIKIKDPFANSRFTSAVAGLKAAQLGDQNIRQGGSQEDEINFKGDLKRAELEQEDAQNKLRLLQELQKKGDASTAEVADAEHRLSVTETTLQTVSERSTNRYSAAEVASSASRIADAKANLETAKTVLANANITSSIAGTVYSIPVLKDDFVPMGAGLLNVTDLTRMKIRAYFDEPDIGQLRAGEPVDISWEAKPGMTWHGHVERIPLTVRLEGTRTVGECIIGIDDAKGDLLPNTDITVKVTTDHHSHALTVPREALKTIGTDHFVYRVVDGRTRRTRVEVGLVNLLRAEVTGGLSQSDMVILDAESNELSDGRRVNALR